MNVLLSGNLSRNLRKMYRKGEPGMNRLSEAILFHGSDFKNINVFYHIRIPFSQEG